jgi:hypothetical protein
MEDNTEVQQQQEEQQEEVFDSPLAKTEMIQESEEAGTKELTFEEQRAALVNSQEESTPQDVEQVQL